MRRIIVSLCALAAAAACAFAAAAPAEARVRFPGGSWSQSCQNAYIDGTYLYAQCLDRRNRWRNAFIDLSQCPGTVSNADGRLVCDYVEEPSYPGGGYPSAQRVLPRGNWVDVCEAANVLRGRMEARCYDERGRTVQSSLDSTQCGRGVTVNRGRIVCETGGGRWGQSLGYLPRGNWVDVCIDVGVSNGLMQAKCYDERGRVVNSQLDLRTCRRNDVTAYRGALRCQ